MDEGHRLAGLAAYPATGGDVDHGWVRLVIGKPESDEVALARRMRRKHRKVRIEKNDEEDRDI